MRRGRACVLGARGQPPHLRIDDFEMQPPQDLDDLKQRALSIQGVCKRRGDQVCMSGRLQVHGCVRVIHTIVPFTPYGIDQCVHDLAIRPH